MRRRDRPGGLLQRERRARGAMGVRRAGRGIRLEHGHDGIADEPVDAPAEPLDERRDRIGEVRVQHRGDLGRLVRFREVREARQVGEEPDTSRSPGRVRV